MHGGGHEQGLRSGTLPVPLAVGLGAACALCGEQLEADRARTTALATRLRDGLRERLDGVTLNGHPDQRLPGNVHLSFAGVEAQALLMSLPEVALSTGSACSSAEVKPSHVLRALGLGADLSLASVRFGIGRFNQAEEIEYVIDRVSDRVQRLRRLR